MYFLQLLNIGTFFTTGKEVDSNVGTIKRDVMGQGAARICGGLLRWVEDESGGSGKFQEENFATTH